MSGLWQSSGDASETASQSESGAGSGRIPKADYDALERDYGRKLKLKSSPDRDLVSDYMDWGKGGSYLVYAYEGGIAWDLDKTSELSNGDKVKLTWDVDEKAYKKTFNYKVKCSDITYEVEDLEIVAEFDPFEGVSLEYDGTAPNGYAGLDHPDEEMYWDIDYELSKSDGLSNGDTITVTAEVNNPQYFAENWGKLPSVTSKEFTVEGLASYAMTSAEIPSDMMEKLESQALDVVRAQAASDWNDSYTMTASECIGNYFLSAKHPEDIWGSTNKVTIVVKASLHCSDKDRCGLTDMDYYTCVTFYNAMLLGDGTCSVDLSNYDRCGNSFYVGDSWDSVRGYEKLDSLFSNYVTAEIADYNYEDNVTDVDL